MKNNRMIKIGGLVCVLLFLLGCKSLESTDKTKPVNLPSNYLSSTDTTTISNIKWKTYFSDKNLIALIDTALKNNQELNIVMQEIEISKNEVRAKKGEYLPNVRIGGESLLEKEGRYTRHGAVDEQLEIMHDKAFPEPFSNHELGIYASWELDVWKKLRNAKKSAYLRYLASVEGKNFMQTNLIAEIADDYYELLALDNLLDIVNKSIVIQTEVLEIVKVQKQFAKVSQLAVNRFEAQLLNIKSLKYSLTQEIIEKENHLNFLTGSYPHSISRDMNSFMDVQIAPAQAGIPSQLLTNRPDIRKAELELEASKIDVKAAKANFYPSFAISSGVGFAAFNPSYLLHSESLLYNIAGEIMAPLINRSAIKAAYKTASNKQLQALYTYEQTVLQAYTDVLNQLSKMQNYSQSYENKAKEVELLVQSNSIAGNLFNSARADYSEVLLTQREALSSKMELIEIKMKQVKAKINVYRALGGGRN